MSEIAELKPCPFCSGEAEIMEEHDHAWVEHKGCPVDLGGFETRHEAIAAWNRRTEVRLSINAAWDELCNADDRTSPPEYPDMCLITRSELAKFMDTPRRVR